MGLLGILIFLILGFALLAFGYTLFFRISPGGRGREKAEGQGIEGQAGDPQTCPVCAARLPPGVLVRSAVYPPVNGTDRIMHIMGCPFCLGRRQLMQPNTWTWDLPGRSKTRAKR